MVILSSHGILIISGVVGTVYRRHSGLPAGKAGNTQVLQNYS